MPVGTCVRCDQTIMRAVNLLEYKVGRSAQEWEWETERRGGSPWRMTGRSDRKTPKSCLVHFKIQGNSFHTNCFTCSICTNNIAGPKGFINDPTDQLKQYCHECYSREVAPKCNKCEEAIVGPEGGVRHRGNPFHRNCFLCQGCDQSLAEKRFRSLSLSVCARMSCPCPRLQVSLI